MLVTSSWIKKNYERLNKLYFGNKLPNNLIFKTCRSKTAWGWAEYKYDYINDTIIPKSVKISNYYDSPEDVKIRILLHEMIHIEDYVFHPEHFIKNNMRVSKRQYDPHGTWFMNEANRITKESGYNITNHVTLDCVKASKYSKHTQTLLENKKDIALICAIYGNNGKIWMFKTDMNKASYVKNKGIHNYGWNSTLCGIKRIKFYKFENERLANQRSCYNSFRGWLYDRQKFIELMEKYKATEIYID